MSDDDKRVDVAIGVDLEALAKGMNETVFTTEDALISINRLFESTSEQISETMETLIKGLTEQFKESGKKAEELGGKMRNIALTTGLIQPAINAVMGLNQKIQDTIDTTIRWTKETSSLAKTLGTSTEVAGGLSKALQRLDISTDSYKGAVFQLQRSLDSQEEAFNKNGIATRKANGELLDMQQVMMNTISRLKDMKPGYDRNALAMMAFGRSAKDLQGLMNLTAVRLCPKATAVISTKAL